MNYNTQNAKIASITEKTLIIGIDVGSETHYARAFSWRNYEYSKKPFAFSNDEAGFAAFKEWMDDIAEKHEMEVIIPGMEKGAFPLPIKRKDGTPVDIQEERRLFYVGMTRAREELIFVTCGEPSEFLSELPEHLVQREQALVRESPQTRQMSLFDFLDS